MAKRRTGKSVFESHVTHEFMGKLLPGDVPSASSAAEHGEAKLAPTKEYTGGFKPITGEELLKLRLPPTRFLLDPIIPAKSVNMLYARAGVGKTFAALHMGLAVASGGEFLGFKAPGASRVLLIDGELGFNALQERLEEALATGNYPGAAQNMQFLTFDMELSAVMPNLSTPEGQDMVSEFAKDFDLIIVDNISTLCKGGKENEAESWVIVQDWALRMRAAGKTVVFIHHAGKNGVQRGTSNRETIMNTIMKLENIEGKGKGIHFMMSFDKARNLFDDSSIEAKYSKGAWTVTSGTALERDAKRLYGEGKSYRKIAAELGIDKNKVERLVKA